MSTYKKKKKTSDRQANGSARCSGLLSFVDLAGSERVVASQVQGERLREALPGNAAGFQQENGDKNGGKMASSQAKA